MRTSVVTRNCPVVLRFLHEFRVCKAHRIAGSAVRTPAPTPAVPAAGVFFWPGSRLDSAWKQVRLSRYRITLETAFRARAEECNH